MKMENLIITKPSVFQDLNLIGDILSEAPLTVMKLDLKGKIITNSMVKLVDAKINGGIECEDIRILNLDLDGDFEGENLIIEKKLNIKGEIRINNNFQGFLYTNDANIDIKGSVISPAINFLDILTLEGIIKVKDLENINEVNLKGIIEVDNIMAYKWVKIIHEELTTKIKKIKSEKVKISKGELDKTKLKPFLVENNQKAEYKTPEFYPIQIQEIQSEGKVFLENCYVHRLIGAEVYVGENVYINQFIETF